MKSEIRKINKIKRAAMDGGEVTQKSNAASKLFLASSLYENAKHIMLYKSLGNETDTTDIINAAFRDGKIVYFPVTDAQSGEITPCFATNETEFVKGAFSVSEPANTEVADVGEIELILVPGIAFDKKGARVGFGKGCYDRLLQNSSAIKVGFCYDFQLCEEIPSEQHDVTMDYIVTETRIINCKEN